MTQQNYDNAQTIYIKHVMKISIKPSTIFMMQDGTPGSDLFWSGLRIKERKKGEMTGIPQGI